MALAPAGDELDEAHTLPHQRFADIARPSDSQLTPVKTMLGIGETPPPSVRLPATAPREAAPQPAPSGQGWDAVDAAQGSARTAPLPMVQRQPAAAPPAARAEVPPAAGLAEDRLLAAMAGGDAHADGETLPPMRMSSLLGGSEASAVDIFDDAPPKPVPRANPTPPRPTPVVAPALAPAATAAPQSRGLDGALIGLWIAAVLAIGGAVAVFLLL